ncbi:MAG: DUF998 domain-containing protein [Ignisphaera sp.]
MKGWRYITIPLLSIAIPLLCISISIYLSPWFNLFDNALSDLGHATRSSVAPIFNFGLSLGGFLIALTAITIFSKIHRSLAYLGTLCSYTLILIAVFDEIYRSLHYWVSVAFFLSLGALLIDYVVIMKNIARKISATIALAIAIISWILHLVYGLPRGAAIPELISIFCAAPFYIDIALQYTSSK